MTHRPDQVAAQLQRVIAEVLQRRIADPRIRGVISITQIKVSPDLRHATVMVSIMPVEHERVTMGGLRHAAGHIRSLVRKAVAIRSVPELEFKLDTSLKKQAEVFEALNRARERTDLDVPPEGGADENEGEPR
ncbi:MAG: 30S ribosome-binding factor RbfA [Phycisphaeraceae bacterium]